MPKKMSATTLLNIVLLAIIIVVMVFTYFYFISTLKQDNKICMNTSQYEKIIQQQTPQQPQTPPQQQTPQRDYRVLNDQLYPPLNRTDAVTQDMLQANINNRNMYISTNDKMDSYRLIGYLINKDIEKDSGGNNWKLFARDKDRNTADFYMIPANNNYDVKIHISADMVKGERLRDVYSVPKYITFNSPMLNTTQYEYVEIPKADLTSSSRYL